MATVTIDLSELGVMLKGLGPSTISFAVEAAAKASVQAMLRDVLINRMTGQELGVVTGTARRSMRGSSRNNVRGPFGASGGTTRTPTRVVGDYGSPLGYVRAHEEGYRGPANVRAHSRTRKGKTHDVRAHLRQVNIRARHFMRNSLVKETGGGNSKLSRRIVKALRIAAKQGRIPQAGELGV